jgi:hypothetical protein
VADGWSRPSSIRYGEVVSSSKATQDEAATDAVLEGTKLLSPYKMILERHSRSRDGTGDRFSCHLSVLSAPAEGLSLHAIIGHSPTESTRTEEPMTSTDKLVRRARVPLSTAERLKVGGLLLVVIAAPLVGWWAYVASTSSEDAVAQLFAHLEHGDNAAAFDMLAPDLQAELGSAEVLGQRWKAAGVRGVSLEPGCVGVGTSFDIVKMKSSVTRQVDERARAFELGAVTGSCGRDPGLPLTANVKDGRVAALRLEL